MSGNLFNDPRTIKHQATTSSGYLYFLKEPMIVHLWVSFVVCLLLLGYSILISVYGLQLYMVQKHIFTITTHLNCFNFDDKAILSSIYNWMIIL